MEQQDISISCGQNPDLSKRKARNWNIDVLARAVRKAMEIGEVYKTDSDVYEYLLKTGSQALSRNAEENKRKVRRVLIQNSSLYGCRLEDGCFYLKSRLREVA